jgi:thymidine phosphorylase
MSKKLAEGIEALVMDVKCGRGAFMKNPADARRLAESLVTIGRANGVRTEALLTAMDTPLGRAIGNSLEVIECLETLKGRGPKDLETLSVVLAARMLRLGGGAETDQEAEVTIRAALSSGRALEKFREIIAEQGGDPRVVDDYSRLPTAPGRTAFTASCSGYLTRLDAELVGRATMVLGAGRDRVEDVIDPAVGAKLMAKTGDPVRAGDVVVELVYRDPARLDTALELLRSACQIKDEPPTHQELILETIR